MKTLFIDMDGVLVDLEDAINTVKLRDKELYDYYKEAPNRIPGIYRNPNLILGAAPAICRLKESNKYDMFIATTADWNNPYSGTDKRFWITDTFGNWFDRKIITTHRKDLLVGDYLIDDREVNGAKDFMGEFLHFGGGCKFPTWESILEYLL